MEILKSKILSEEEACAFQKIINDLGKTFDNVQSIALAKKKTALTLEEKKKWEWVICNVGDLYWDFPQAAYEHFDFEVQQYWDGDVQRMANQFKSGIGKEKDILAASLNMWNNGIAEDFNDVDIEQINNYSLDYYDGWNW